MTTSFSEQDRQFLKAVGINVEPTLDETRRALEQTRWNREAAGEVRNPSDQGELPPTGVRGEPAPGAAGRGNRSGVAAEATDS